MVCPLSFARDDGGVPAGSLPRLADENGLSVRLMQSALTCLGVGADGFGSKGMSFTWAAPRRASVEVSSFFMIGAWTPQLSVFQRTPFFFIDRRRITIPQNTSQGVSGFEASKKTKREATARGFSHIAQ